MWLRILPKDLELRAKRLDCEYWLSSLSRYKSANRKFPKKSDKIVGNDLFAALYQYDPELKEEAVDPAFHTWLEHQLNSKKMGELRYQTMGDRQASVLGAVKLYQELMRPKTSQFKAVMEARRNIEQLSELSQQGFTEQQKQQIKNLQEALAESLEAEGLEEELSKAAEIVSEDIKAGRAFVNILAPSQGFSLDGTNDRLLEFSLDEQLMSLLKNQQAFRKILRSLGRIRLIANGVKSKKPKPSPSPVSIETGKDLDKMVPLETVYLSDPELEDLWLDKFVNGRLLQYKKTHRPHEGKGPIICLLDVSGSMTGVNEINAKAFCLQLVRMAIEENRQICYIPFATTAGSPYYLKDEKDLLYFITKQNYPGLGRGTNFDAPLQEAIEVIEQERRYKNADIVMLSDGYSRVSPNISKEVLACTNTYGARIMGVLFNGNWAPDMQALMSAWVTCDYNGSLDWVEPLMEKMI